MAGVSGTAFPARPETGGPAEANGGPSPALAAARGDGRDVVAQEQHGPVVGGGAAVQMSRVDIDCCGRVGATVGV